MFGFGWGEIVVIGIVALIAIGPKELPTVLRSIGHWMGKIRRMANEFQGQFNEALREADLTDLKKQAEEMTTSITTFDPLADTQKEMEKTFDFDDPLKDKPAEVTTSHAPEAPPLPGATVLDGATLPASALPPIDVPMPELPAPVTEQDFAPVTTQPVVTETAPNPEAKSGGSAS